VFNTCGKKIESEEKTDFFQTNTGKTEASSPLRLFFFFSLSLLSRAHTAKKNTNKYKVWGAGW
jgi:hypothetical protein